MTSWLALLKHAPALLAAADALLVRARSNQPAPSQGVEERLRALEQGSQDSAQLLKELTQQLNDLTMAHAAATKRARAAVWIAGVAAIMAIAALFVAFR